VRRGPLVGFPLACYESREAVKKRGVVSDPGPLAPPERLLVKLAGRDGVRASLADDRAVIEDPSTRARLIRLAMEHGIHGLVLRALVRSPLMGTLSLEIAQELTVEWNRLRRQAALWDLERDRLLSRLEREGLTPVILKGGALRETAYGEPAERSLGDLDLLVSPAQLEQAQAALERAGYRTVGTEAMIEAYRLHHFDIPFAHANGFVVEIHWALSRARLGFQLDERAFLSRAVSRPRASGVALRVPSAEDMILHLASQNEEDAFGRLRRLVDLDRVVASTPQLDWAYLGEAARQGGVQTFTALSLRLAQLILDTPLPVGFVEGLAPSRLSRLNLTLLRPVSWVISEPARRSAAAGEVLLFWTTVGWRNRLRRYLVVAWPEADPLAWMWERPAQNRRPPRRVWPLVKLVGYQLLVYGRGLAAALTTSGRRHLRFWT